MTLQLQQVLDQEGTCLKQAPSLPATRTFQDGHCQRPAEQQRREESPIEIKLMTQDQRLGHKLIQKISLVQNAILVQATDFRETKPERSKIRCKEGLA